MDFEDALAEFRNGSLLRRKSWHNEVVYAYLDEEEKRFYELLKDDKKKLQINPVYYVPKVSDILSEDWQTVRGRR